MAKAKRAAVEFESPIAPVAAEEQTPERKRYAPREVGSVITSRELLRKQGFTVDVPAGDEWRAWYPQHVNRIFTESGIAAPYANTELTR